jgi:hypothetical protein
MRYQVSNGAVEDHRVASTERPLLTKRRLHRFKSDASTGANDENFSNGPFLSTALRSQARDASKPSQASPAATTQAIQLAHSGIEIVVPTVTGQPLRDLQIT